MNGIRPELGAKFDDNYMDAKKKLIDFARVFDLLHSVAANGRWCGDQRPPCGLKTAG